MKAKLGAIQLSALNGSPVALRRRGLVAGAAGLLGGWLAARLGRPERATADTNTALLIGVGANQPSNVGDKTGLVIPPGGTLSPCVFQADNTSGSPGTPPPGGYRVAIAGTVAGSDTTSNYRMGVYGQADTPTGYALYGNAVSGGIGVVGTATNSFGVYGAAGAGGNGVVGQSNAAGSAGVYGNAGPANSYGVLGIAPAGAYAAVFNGQVTINGNLAVSGTKSAVVKDSSGVYRTFYAQESPESRFDNPVRVHRHFCCARRGR